MNQLFQQLAAPTSPMASGNANGLPPMFGMLQKFMDFKNSFKGNAREQVQELLKSGKMSQEQFQQLSKMAEGFKGMFNK